MNRPKVLGKGLNALLASRPALVTLSPTTPEPQAPAESVTHVPIDRIEANPAQPRHVFRAEALQELAQSIRANGIIQPLVVRKNTQGLQLVAGERPACRTIGRLDRSTRRRTGDSRRPSP